MSEVARKYINNLFTGDQPFDVFLKTSSSLVAVWAAYHLIFNYKEIKSSVVKRFFKTLKAIPLVDAEIKKQTGKAVSHLKASFKSEGETYLELPASGLPYDVVLARMKEMKETDERKRDMGKISGCIYLGDDQHTAFNNAAYALFANSNPLHPEVFPSVKKFEAEVIKMTLSMMHGDGQSCGAMTSGGTESILMAVKAYRELARERGVTDFELVYPVTAHAAFDKACHYFNIKPVIIPLDNDMKVDTKKLRRAINRNTIAIVGSAPGFPHGIIDPIPELAQIAQHHNIGLHVDTCLGGFVLPFAQQLGYDIPIFDFRLPGVTTMSADTHKYGYSPKGTSIVLFRTPELRAHMYFVAEDWPGGIYASPTIAGSRPGGLIAGAWASMVSIGREGYLKYVDGIMKTAQVIIEGIKNIPELGLVGEPKAMVVAFDSKVLDVYRVNAGMSKRGWNLNALQFPPSLHVCVTAKHIGQGIAFVEDLKSAVAEVRADPNQYKESTAAMYGMAATIPDRSIVRSLATAVIDVMLDP